MDPDEGDVDGKAIAKVEPVGSTLLPAPIASVVSLVTRSSSLYIRLGTFIGGLALDGARVTTLTGLELSRAIIESVLYRAGTDVSTRSTGELGRAEAEGLLERSIATLHSTITNISFAASTGFYISTVALESATDISQQLLGTLDSILGSTDSSRAIASIITLIRREFQNPATGQEGEKVSVADLLMGICGLALLQRWCKKYTEIECRERKYEEVVWDVVVLDDGRRVDVTDEKDSNLLAMGSGSHETLQTIEDLEDDMPEFNLKQKIIRSLPPDCSVSITTSSTTTKTVVVEITGGQLPQLLPPPGVEIIDFEEISCESDDLTPRYKMVYQIVKTETLGTSIEAGPEEAVEDIKIVTENDGDTLMDLGSPTEDISTPETGYHSVLASRESNVPSKIPRRRSVASLHTSPKDESANKAPRESSEIPLLVEPTANQKRTRQPKSASSSPSGSDIPQPLRKLSGAKPPVLKKIKSDKSPLEKKSSFRNALKKGSGTGLANLWNKDVPEQSKPKNTSKPSLGVPTPATGSSKRLPALPLRNASVVSARDAPRAPARGNPNHFSSRDLGTLTPDNIPRSPSRASYYSVHEQRRNSIVSQTDTYSIHSADTRPDSPTAFRTHLRSHSSLMRSRSEKNIVGVQPPSPKNHRRSKSFVPSIYTLHTNNSETSLVVASQPRRSAFEDSETLETLTRTGHVDGLFPEHHIVRNITRFIRFASASYGASFLRVMGIATSSAKSREIDTHHHHEHHSFSNHTQLPPSTILLSSFVDPQGGTDCSGHTETGVPMVHFISLDHESKAVVLTCRGTLGFEDVLTDMTCDYDEITYRAKQYKVHKGIHASAKRLLTSRVLITIKAALEEFPSYGLVLCGHSLGGAVSALLAIMISAPSSTGTAFVTSSDSYHRPQLLLLSSSDSSSQGTAPQPQIYLPPGRPIHVYAYGPPSTFSPSLRLVTRGLITTIVNDQDLVPYLSLGVLHDMQAVALAFKNDDSGAKGEVRRRVWEGLRGSWRDKWYASPSASGGTSEEDDQWAYASLKTLRASMLSAKLVPPGEVFLVESMPVLRRDGWGAGEKGLGKPATRSVVRYVRDVERRFGEVRFGGSMLLDHSPGRYEASLAALGKGVLGGG